MVKVNNILDGGKVARDIEYYTLKELKTIDKQVSIAVVCLGQNVESLVYAKQLKKQSAVMGVKFNYLVLPDKITQSQLEDEINKLNKDKNTTGILLQVPLPKQINQRKIQTMISPYKDVEGVSPSNIGRIFYNDSPDIVPVTSYSAFVLLKSTGVNLRGKEIVIISHSEIVGKPLAMLLLSSKDNSPTVTICNNATPNLSFHTKRADILFSAAGKSLLLTKDMVKDNIIVIDIGISTCSYIDESNKLKTKIVGDVDFEGLREKCSYISPVPGGVGVVTVAYIFKNLVECAKIQKEI